MKPLAAVVAGLIALAAAGCGSTSTTSTPAVAHSTSTTSDWPEVSDTSSTDSSSTDSLPSDSSISDTDYSNTYDPEFESQFIQSCIQAAPGHVSQCQCLLQNIETSVPEKKVLAATHDLAVGNYPQWYTDARDGC